MKCTRSYALLAALPLATAQTFSGFPVDIQQKLDVFYGDISVSNGEQLPRANVASPPNISSPGHMSTTGKAVLIMMDSDIPVNSTSRTTFLHWLAPDITGTTSGTNTSLMALPPSTDGLPYVQPSPPQGDYPHRYSFLLYEQTRTFSIPSTLNASSRGGFNLEAFLQAAGLTTPLAANYMLVANDSGPAKTSFPPALYTASSTLAANVADATATGSSVSGTGSAATASSTGRGNALQAGSGVALLAAIFGMMMM